MVLMEYFALFIYTMNSLKANQLLIINNKISNKTQINK
jgi:hypothetical protein